jgi:hypothetical protein
MLLDTFAVALEVPRFFLGAGQPPEDHEKLQLQAVLLSLSQGQRCCYIGLIAD